MAQLEDALLDPPNVLDGGAYTSFGVITAYYAGFMIPTLYHIPNYRYHGRRMYTNKPPWGAMRGHGVPQPRFAFEHGYHMGTTHGYHVPHCCIVV